MFSVGIFRARQMMLTMGLMVTGLGNASASPNTAFETRDPRPVARAIYELDKRYGWRITYDGEYAALDTLPRRIGKDGAIYFRTMDSGERRPVVMAAILRPRNALHIEVVHSVNKQ